MKKKLQKKGENVLWVLKKALPLHPLSERKPLKKSSLKDLDINKQVVQVLLRVRNRNRQYLKQVDDRFGS